jgi:hypothetical protein
MINESGPVFRTEDVSPQEHWHGRMARQERSFLQAMGHQKLARAFFLVTGLLAAKAEAAQTPTSWRPNPKPSLNAHQDGGVRREILAVQKHGLKNYRDLDQLKRAAETGKLASLEPGKRDWYVLDPGIGTHTDPPNRKFFRQAAKETKAFLSVLSQEYRTHFRAKKRKDPHKLPVTSAVRTERYVDRLRGSGNANVAGGYTSSHLTGMTLDISWKGLDSQERAWMEARLLQEEKAGRIEATKEHGQPVYHFMVIPQSEPRRLARSD